MAGSGCDDGERSPSGGAGNDTTTGEGDGD
jgi:hypothetical protein